MEGRSGELLFMECRVSAGEKEEVWEVEGGDTAPQCTELNT